MDSIVRDVAVSGRYATGMPPEHPADMPAQDLKHFRRKDRRRLVNPASRSSFLKRFAVIGGTAALLAYAFNEMYAVLALGDLTPIERRDFIRWMDSAEQPATHRRRIKQACAWLAAGKRHPAT